MADTRIVTAVIGAGPAGLLFSIISRILYGKSAGDPVAWPLYLFDKREVYERRHRLRIEPSPYQEIQQELRHELFDQLIDFLDANSWKPVVNAFEERLLSLARRLGVHKERLSIGPGPNDITLPTLRRGLEMEGRLRSDELLTIVAADSVHSATRELIRGSQKPVQKTHQYVARLKIEAPRLPEHLGPVEQFKLSKVLGSFLDYRLNPNGYAEVDLFLDPAEHRTLMALGANVKEPIPLTPQLFSRLGAPFLRKIVQYFQGYRPGPCRVWLQSTFELEHKYMKVMTFGLPSLKARVFLVGDAGISLPFFRGMACLAKCAHSLAHVHRDLVLLAHRGPVGCSLSEELREDIGRHFLRPERRIAFGYKILPGSILRVEPTYYKGHLSYVLLHRWLSLFGVHVLHVDGRGHWRSLYRRAPVRRATALADFRRQLDPALRYQHEVETIERREFAIVEARARLIRGVREFIRVSSLVPFPVQSWFLSMPEQQEATYRLSPGFFLNLTLAFLSSFCALLGPIIGLRVHPFLGALYVAALPLQTLGGVCYYYTRTHEPGSLTLLKALWRFQIVLLFAGGVATTAIVSWSRGRLSLLHAALAWLVLALCFVGGLYLFEYLNRRWWSVSNLAESRPSLARDRD